MSNQERVKHVFPCANTSKGFYSFFDKLLVPSDISKIFILKGSPGVGKSTFMKKIAEEIHEKDFVVEYLHCSLDDSSLDGILVPKLKLAVVNGITPHVVDLKNSVCIEEIINLDEFCNRNEICTFKPNIIELNNEIDRVFSRSYKYLEAAYKIYSDIIQIYTQCTNYGKVNVEIDRILELIFGDLNVTENIGKTRRFFAGAITCFGLKNYIDSIISNLDNLYIIKGEVGTGIGKMFEIVADYAINRGFDVEIYHCSFNPNRIEHVIIPQLSIGFVTSNQYHNIYKTNGEEVVDFNQFVNEIEIKKYQSQLYFNRRIYNELLNQAILTISEAKRLHDLLETYYTPNINFELVDKKREEILQRILK